MTLLQFVKKCGGKSAAAVAVGVDPVTYWRWLTKRSKPQGNNLRRLVELGVVVSITLVLGGCAAASRVDLVSARVLDWGGGNSIYIVEDPATQAVCYVYSRGGVNCARPK